MSKTKIPTTILATITHPIISHPPKMTDGEIMPKVVREFENHCMGYFFNAKDSVADDVTKILGYFENSIVDDWTATNCEHLIKLTFKLFMKEFQEQWLPDSWEHIVCNQMLGTCLDPNRHKFETWANQVMSHNVMLWGTRSHMTDNQLQVQLNIMLDIELQTLATVEDMTEITDLHKWMTCINEIDNK